MNRLNAIFPSLFNPPIIESFRTKEKVMNEREIRLECLKEVFRNQGGNVEKLIEAASKAAAFVISGDCPKSRPDSQHKG